MPRHGASRGLQLFPEQPVAVAVPVQPPPAPGTEPGAGLALGVELHQVEPAGGHIGQEGDIMVLAHLVGDGEEILPVKALPKKMKAQEAMTPAVLEGAA